MDIGCLDRIVVAHPDTEGVTVELAVSVAGRLAPTPGGLATPPPTRPARWPSDGWIRWSRYRGCSRREVQR